MNRTWKATPGCENGPAFANARPYLLAVRRERLRRFVWRDRPRAYEPLEPVELEPWSGDAGLGVAGVGLEVGVGAGAGDTGLGAMWLAGAAGRGAIGAAPTCVGEGDVGAEGGGMVEAGRGGGEKGFGAGAGDAAAGLGGGGAAGRGAGAGAAAIGLGGGGATGFGAGIAAAGCLGAVF